MLVLQKALRVPLLHHPVDNQSHFHFHPLFMSQLNLQLLNLIQLLKLLLHKGLHRVH